MDSKALAGKPPSTAANRHIGQHVDIHTHVVPLPHARWLMEQGDRVGVQISRDTQGLLRMRTRFNSVILEKRYTDSPLRLEEMDAKGIDIQLLSLITPLLMYWLKADIAAEVCRLQNEAIAEMVRSYPTRFAGAATVPLQAPDMAAHELEYAVTTLGMKAVQIATNVDGRNLDWQALDPFWTEVERNQTLVFIHPGGAVIGAKRMSRYSLRNLVGLLAESTLAMASLIFGAVLERHPGLKICIAHGGGFGPYALGRWEHGYRVRAECRSAIPHSPRTYGRQLFYDTAIHDQRLLSYLVEAVGVQQLLLGSDYPADMSVPDPAANVASLSRLSTAERASILGLNAMKLLGISSVQ